VYFLNQGDYLEGICGAYKASNCYQHLITPCCCTCFPGDVKRIKGVKVFAGYCFFSCFFVAAYSRFVASSTDANGI